MDGVGVTKITVSEDVALVTFCRMPTDPSVMAGVFSDLASAGINVDMISQTAPQGRTVDLSFTIPSCDLLAVLDILNHFREAHPSVRPMMSNGNCKIQLYGDQMREFCGVAASVVSAVAQSGADLMLITTSEVDISLLIPQACCMDCVHALEKVFSVQASYG